MTPEERFRWAITCVEKSINNLDEYVEEIARSTSLGKQRKFLSILPSLEFQFTHLLNGLDKAAADYKTFINSDAATPQLLAQSRARFSCLVRSGLTADHMAELLAAERSRCSVGIDDTIAALKEAWRLKLLTAKQAAEWYQSFSRKKRKPAIFGPKMRHLLGAVGLSSLLTGAILLLPIVAKVVFGVVLGAGLASVIGAASAAIVLYGLPIIAGALLIGLGAYYLYRHYRANQDKKLEKWVESKKYAPELSLTERPLLLRWIHDRGVKLDTPLDKKLWRVVAWAPRDSQLNPDTLLIANQPPTYLGRRDLARAEGTDYQVLEDDPSIQESGMGDRRSFSPAAAGVPRRL